METYKYYQRAIDIVLDDLDWREICVTLAKENPKALCDAVDKLPEEGRGAGFKREIWRIVNDEGKIQAIKFVRDKKKLGLKEAKDMVEDMIDRGMVVNGRVAQGGV